MSVEYCVVRVTPQTFKQVQEQSGFLQDLMDELYATPIDSNSQKVSIDSRDVTRGHLIDVPAVLRMLHIDEFTTSLLVYFMEESSAFYNALAGWGRVHILSGVSYGYGEISYYFPDEVARVALELNTYPNEILEERFWDGAENYRTASIGYFKDDQAILAHQRLFVELLRKFYNEAAQDGDFVLLLTG
jgi:hypothetical protein